MSALTVVPAYGRDYRSQKHAAEAWAIGKDFIVADMSSPHNGRYVSCRDLPSGQVVMIRYSNLRRVTPAKAVWKEAETPLG